MSYVNQADSAGSNRGERPVESNPPFWVKHRTILLLVAILLAAAFFRFYGRDFDQGSNQHPDERAIVDSTLRLTWPSSVEQLLNPGASPLNLRATSRYPWGSLPVYVTRISGWVADQVVSVVKPELKGYYVNDYHGVQLLGRSMASVFDLFTILLVFLIGRRLFSSSAGLIAAALVAFAVTNIQIAHFYITEPFLVTFMVAALYFSVVLMQRPSWWVAALAGTFVGLSVASKITSALIFLAIIAAVVLRAAYRRHSRRVGAELGDPIGIKPSSAAERELTFGAHLLRGLRYVLIAIVFVVIAFGVSEPYVLWQFDFSKLQPVAGQSLRQTYEDFMMSNPWGKSIIEEAGIQSGEVDIPYTRQYIGTVPILYHFEQLVLWGVGVIPGLLMLAGIFLAIWMAIKRKPAEILLLAYAVPYFATILIGETKWMRYMLPLVPAFSIMAAALLVRGGIWARKRFATSDGTAGNPVRSVQRNTFAILTILVIGSAFLWSLAFSNIYSQPHSRVQAGRWMNANGEAGSTVSNDSNWDDPLPYLDGSFVGGEQYHFDLYDDRAPDDELNYLRDKMAVVDYITLTSNRIYGSVSRLPWRYPVQTRFYQLLYAGKLGYELVHTQQVTPELLGVRINDQLADESFTVYDHPRVDIFKKVSTLTDDQLRTLFSTALDRPLGQYNTSRHFSTTEDKSLLYPDPLADAPAVNDYAWNPLAQPDTQWIGLLIWLVAVYVLGFAALPIVFVVFRRLPDRGYAFAKLAGLLLVSWGVWLLASARLVPFTAWSVLGFLVVLALLGWLVLRLGVGPDLRAFMRSKRRLIVFYEVLFLAAFAFFLFIRMLNPDLWHPFFGGEKPMEFGFLNAILRSPWMPPADPFFAGGVVNYYYYGQFIIGCLIKLTGTDPALAFNFAIPLLYGLTFVSSASVIYNVVAWSQRHRGGTHEVSRAGMAFGVLAGLLMLAVGNLHSLLQLIMIYVPGASQNLISLGQQLGFVGPSWNSAYSTFNFWDPSRVIRDTINEFPYWSFLYADLHPHLINMPFTIMAAALGLNLALAGRFVQPMSAAGVRLLSFGERFTASLAWLWGRGANGVLTFAFTAVAVGLLFVVNSWDFPVYLGFLGGAVFIALILSRASEADDLPRAEETQEIVPAEPRLGTGGVWALILASGASLVLLAGLAVLAYIPFLLNFKAFYTQILPLVDGGLIQNTGTIMQRTNLWEFLVHWAIFVFVAVSYLVVQLWSFPWGEAVDDLAARIPIGRAKPQAGPVPTAAFAAGGGLPRRGLRSLDLAPAGAGGAGGMAESTVPFASYTTDEELEPRPASTTPGGETAETLLAAPVEDVDIVPATDGQGAGDDLPTVPIESIGAHDGQTVGEHVIVYEPLPNWLAEANDQIQQTDLTEKAVPQLGAIPLWLGLVMLAATAGIVVLQLVTGQLLLALLAALIGGIMSATLSTTKSPARMFTSLLLVVAMLVALGVEVVYLADHLQGGPSFRMNTVFKFYIQVWLLFAMGSAGAVYYIIYGLRDSAARKAESVQNAGVETITAPVVVPVAADLPTGNGHTVEAVDGAADPVLSHEPGEATRPLPPEDNWLVWSADDIEDAALPQDETARMDDSTTQISASDTFGDPPEPQGIEWAAPAMRVEAVESTPAVPQNLTRPRWTPAKLAWLAVFALFFAASFLYVIFGTPDRLRQRFNVSPPVGTLDGLAYMTTGQYSTSEAPFNINLRYDYDGIKWLNSHVPGLATIAELPAEYYRAGGMRVAANTGLPMVIGGLHQEEQRADTYARLVGDRRRDMEEFFSTGDVQRALVLMSKYDMDYIYLGQLEQGKAGDAGMKKFQQLADNDVLILREVYRSDVPEGVTGTIIYEVVHSKDKDPSNVVGVPVANSGIPGISITPLPTNTPVPPPTPPVDNPELKQLIQAVTDDPNNRDKRFALIQWFQNNGYPLEAAKELENLVKLDPTNVSLRHQLGDMYEAAGQPDEALKAWEDAIKVAPDNPDAHNKVGIAYMNRRRLDDALKEFDATVKINAAFVESWFHMGEVYERKGDVEGAKRAYQSVISNSREENGWKESAQRRLNEIR